jgi:hypothetical protein
MNAHKVCGGCFVKYDIGWVSYFLQQKVGKP